MREDAQDQVRGQRDEPIDPLVRAEWNGNKYYVPRSQTVTRRPRRHRAWVTWALLAGLVVAYWLTIVFVFPWIITGRLG